MKTKRPYGVVKPVADEVLQRLSASCVRLELAGSLRRKKAEIGDIEIVAVPKLALNLFGEPTGRSLVDDEIATCADMGVIKVVKGGHRYKQFIVVSVNGHEYQVDLFLQPDPTTWGINFMLRTGPAEFSRRMVTAKEKGGLKPNDLAMFGACVWRDHVFLDTPEEADVFKLWGMDFILPEDRR